MSRVTTQQTSIHDTDLDLDALRPGFARMTRVARDLFDWKAAEVVIFRDGSIWRSGDPEGKYAGEAPLAAQIVARRALAWVPDTRLDAFWKNHPWITGKPGFRAFVGAPIILQSGEAVGALVVFDFTPHEPDDRLGDRLLDVAGAVAQDIDRALAMLARDRAESEVVEALDRSERAKRRLRIATRLAGLYVWELNHRTGAMESDGIEQDFYDWPVTPEERLSQDYPTIHPDDRERVRDLWRQQREARKSGPVEYRINRQDQREVWVSSTIELIANEDGAPVRMTGAMVDITERKQAEAAMARALAAAEAANRAKIEFLANMSHELRTPLNGVIGLASVLASTQLTAQQRELLETMEGSARCLEALVSDLLDLSRIESGRVQITASDFALPDLVAECVGMFRTAAAGKGLALTTRIAPEAARGFIGDRLRIGQVVSNLISNALKFTNIGGVEVSVAAECRDEGARLTFGVADTGIGFDAETAARIFDRFEQADASATRQHGGAGLGLSICRSLAERMAGEIVARSELGQGSTFEFMVTLPYGQAVSLPTQTPPHTASEVAGAGTDEPDQADESFRPPRVLVADDHVTNRRVVELILSSIGIELYAVENGAQAVEQATQQQFDLILMDVQMPVMDGHAAIRAIREMEARLGRPRTTIYTLTANALPEHAEASIAAGADAHLTKPIAANGLIAAVERACMAYDEDDAEAQASRSVA